MKKEEQIKSLKDFSKLIHDWFESIRNSDNEKQIKEIETAMSIKWGVVKEIFKLLNINHGGDLTGNNNFKGLEGDFFIEGFVGMDMHPYRVRNLRIIESLTLAALGKVRTDIIVSANILPDIHLVINILDRFPDIVSRWKYRRKNKENFEIVDEYDIQDIVYTMLKGSFPTLQYENPNQKSGITSSISDFTIDELRLFIETKYINDKEDGKRIQEECKKDLVSYSKQESCNTIIFFIYDPNHCIDNRDAFRESLGNKFSDGKNSVEITTIIIN